MLDKQEVTKKVKELQLPDDQYIVISGSSLAGHGIRKTRDVDIVATPELFESLKKRSGWKLVKKYKERVEFLERGVVEIASRLFWSGYDTSLEEALRTKDMISGVPFMNLQEVIKFKQAMGRQKDKQDIVLIKKYLQDTV